MPRSTFITLPPQASEFKSHERKSQQPSYCTSKLSLSIVFSMWKRQTDSWHLLFGSQDKQKTSHNTSAAALEGHWSHTTLQQPDCQASHACCSNSIGKSRLPNRTYVFFLVAVFFEVISFLLFLNFSSAMKLPQYVKYTWTIAFVHNRSGLWSYLSLFRGTYFHLLQKLLALESKNIFKPLF